TVKADTQAPKVGLTFSANPVRMGTSVTINVTATDDVGVASLSLTVGGGVIALDTNGRATLPVPKAGQFAVVAQATDAAGNPGQATATLSVIDPTDTQAPTVDLSSLADGTVITAPIDLKGTVSDTNLLSYSVSVAPLGTADFKELFRGTSSTTNGVLGTI